MKHDTKNLCVFSLCQKQQRRYDFLFSSPSSPANGRIATRMRITVDRCFYSIGISIITHICIVPIIHVIYRKGKTKE